MRDTWVCLCLISVCICEILVVAPVFAMQTLAEAARKEAERRENLQRLGIEEKVIEGNEKCTSREGNVSLFTPFEVDQKDRIRSSSDSVHRSSLRQYRAKLQKLDKDIRKGEARLQKFRDRMESLRRKGLRIGNIKGLSRNEESQDRLQAQIEELQVDMKLLRKERREVYDSGRKDGFLPGELEAKGIIP